MTNDTVKTVLRDAAAVITTRGLHKGSFTTEASDGPVCAAGAVSVAIFGAPDAENEHYAGAADAGWFTYVEALDELLASFYHAYGSVAEWNDVPERTQAEVVAQLHAVADSL